MTWMDSSGRVIERMDGRYWYTTSFVWGAGGGGGSCAPGQFVEYDGTRWIVHSGIHDSVLLEPAPPAWDPKLNAPEGM